jgi:hypothetical protein
MKGEENRFTQILNLLYIYFHVEINVTITKIIKKKKKYEKGYRSIYSLICKISEEIKSSARNAYWWCIQELWCW